MQGTLSEEEGYCSTLELLIQIACFYKKKKNLVLKGADFI